MTDQWTRARFTRWMFLPVVPCTNICIVYVSAAMPIKCVDAKMSIIVIFVLFEKRTTGAYMANICRKRQKNLYIPLSVILLFLSIFNRIALKSFFSFDSTLIQVGGFFFSSFVKRHKANSKMPSSHQIRSWKRTAYILVLPFRCHCSAFFLYFVCLRLFCYFLMTNHSLSL